MNLKERIKKVIAKYSSTLSIRYTEYRYRKKINDNLKLKPRKDLSRPQRNQVKSYFSTFEINNINTNWHKFYYNANGEFHNNYIPEDLFYSKIEPVLNREEFYTALSDKNLLSTFFTNVNQPTTIIKNMNGFFYDANNKFITKNQAIDTCLNKEELVIKPSIESGSGKNVKLVSLDLNENEKNIARIEKILTTYDKDFIIQEKLSQNSLLKKLNPSSVNSVRILSYFSASGTVILSSVLRVGGSNEFADNAGEKTVACGIDKEGKLKSVFDDYGNKFSKSMFGAEINSFEVPMYLDILETAKECHLKIPYFKLVSWDFTVNHKNEVVLIEANPRYQGMYSHQLNNGPIFGKYTDEILNDVQNF